METADKEMTRYYARRASEYEHVYEKSERQADIKTLAEMLGSAFAGQDVLEVACGTGYWTQIIAGSAKSIVATDINTEVLDIARGKDYGACRAEFVQADAYVSVCTASGFTAGFHGFWWSHIPIQRIADFLASFHSALPDGAPVVVVDNAYVEGSSTPISRRDEDGNTHQMRRLQDGSQHEVLKNFPTPSELRARMEPCAEDVQVIQLEYYWILLYRKKG